MQNPQINPSQQTPSPPSYQQPYSSQPFQPSTASPNWLQSLPQQFPPTQQPMPLQQYKGRKVPLWLFVIVLFWALGTSTALGIHIGNANSALSASEANPRASTNAVPTTSSSQAQQTTNTYHGPGNLKTDPITITESTWKMTWTCDPNSFDGIQWNFSVSLYHTDGTFLEPYAINEICSPGITSGSKVEYQGGTFYLEILAEGNWSLLIQEAS